MTAMLVGAAWISAEATCFSFIRTTPTFPAIRSADEEFLWRPCVSPNNKGTLCRHCNPAKGRMRGLYAKKALTDLAESVAGQFCNGLWRRGLRIPESDRFKRIMSERGKRATVKGESQSDVARALLISDQNYFKKGATNIHVSSGIFSMIPGFKAMPAAFVLHSIDEKEISEPDIWVKDAELAFINNKAETIRIYSQEDNSSLSEILEKSGYRKTIEIGLEMKPEGVAAEEPDEKMIPVELNDFLEYRTELSKDAGIGPDGHDMRSGEYARLEFHKIHAGYMKPFFTGKRAGFRVRRKWP